jgi:HK97 family phage prohead protease
MKNEVRSLRAEMRVATNEDGTRTVSGLIPYNALSVDLGGFKELIAPGAFSSALGADADVLALRDHDPKLLLGRTKSGTLQLTDSPEGLRYTLSLPNTGAGNDLAESISRGDLDATSFGFCTIEDSWVCDDDGNVIRTLKQVDLLECSPCSFPAYPDSHVTVRSVSIPAEIVAQVAKRNAPAVDDELETLKLRVALCTRK